MRGVLIVDDEPAIQTGLRSLIQWESYGFQVKGTAQNAEEAYQFHEKSPVSLMIVDMKMPGMSGIELIETIRETDKHVRFIILSGHAEFDFARRALQSQVEGYLLKPVDEDELETHLARLSQGMAKEAELSPTFVKALLLNSESLPTVLSIDHQLLVIHMEKNTVEPFQETFKIVETLFRERSAYTCVPLKKDRLIVILGKRQAPWNQEIRGLRSKAAERQRVLTIARSEPLYRSDEVPVAFESLKEQIAKRVFLGAGLAEVVSLDESRFDVWLQEKNIIEALYYAIDIRKTSTVSALIQSFGDQLRLGHYSEVFCKQKSAILLSEVLGRFSPGQIAGQIAELYTKNTLQEVIDCLQQTAQNTMSMYGSEGAEWVVKQMVDWIHENYHTSIRLETFGLALNYNSAYLGKVFRKSTGISFRSYVDQVRMSHAKTLLGEGKKVYDVANIVGYSSVDYFHLKFKKHMNMSPTEYKKHTEDQGF
ncbi:response regulator transcription factor [Aureibacillus halotolerans]|uniref:AraC family two component transcriptional regulator n=1 Tax=Aureibacillus halotolerans TaxID=1508390 RepID=A0A4R6TW83_9BACI|nr:response regulator [Aureibacillus halotolerans]TDQ36269.1 AraC family two component transcriptional regulator [Aureibacillus halotolerans]